MNTGLKLAQDKLDAALACTDPQLANKLREEAAKLLAKWNLRWGTGYD